MNSGGKEKKTPRPIRVIDWLRRVEDGLLLILLSAMIALSGMQILLRNFWQGGMTWADPLLRVMVLWIALLGAMAATRSDRHITVDILSRHLPAKGRVISRLLTDLFTACVCALIAYHGGRFVLMEYQAETLAFATVPAWLCESIIPLGFGIIALRFLCSGIAQIRQLAGNRP
ncbi:MAG: TRAP transporter small permease [Gammaproteobacteria bacterium]